MLTAYYRIGIIKGIHYLICRKTPWSPELMFHIEDSIFTPATGDIFYLFLTYTLACICKHLALIRGKLYPKSFSLNTFKEQKLEAPSLLCIHGKSDFHFPPSGTLVCLNIKVYKLILKYGILRMFQSKVKLVFRTLLEKAEITVWLRGLKCSCLQLLSTSFY